MVASYSLDKSIKKGSKLHQRIAKKLESRISLAKRHHTDRCDKWREAEERVIAYLPESEKDAARRAERTNGRPVYTTIQIPYSYAMLMSAHTYWTSVFFARSPVLQFAGISGEGEMQVQAVEAMMNYQTEVGGHMGPYYIWLYDGGKYGCGILGHYWEREKIHYGQIVQLENPDGSVNLAQATMEVEGYVGNKVYNVSPFDFMHDPRVPFGRFQEGEFCVSIRRLGWSHILRRRDQGYFNSNIDELRHHVGTDKERTQGAANIQRPNFLANDFVDVDINEKEVKHPAGAVFYEVYVELVPNEWGLGDTKYPQKWCFTITEDFGLIVGASPLGYIHGKFPFSVIEPEVEAYGVYNRGFVEILEPVQNTMDWLLNTHFYNVRAALNNQFIVDPSKLIIKDAKNAGPGFMWRLRPEAYGTDLDKMFKQVPVTDVTRTHLTDMQGMMNIGEKTLGINDQIMGSLNAGGRKTATEVRTSTGFGVNRLKTVSEYMSATAFAPHAAMLVSSSQQNYDGQKKFRIAGQLALDAGQAFMTVTPEDIAGAYSFVPVDGSLPVDRMAQANLWKELLAAQQRLPPQVLMQYDWGKIFAWMAQLAGLKNIQQMRVQVVPDQQLQGQAQAGNVIPMPTSRGLPGPGAGAATQAGLDSLIPQTEGDMSGTY